VRINCRGLLRRAERKEAHAYRGKLTVADDANTRAIKHMLPHIGNGKGQT
jgi:hypothetical protein